MTAPARGISHNDEPLEGKIVPFGKYAGRPVSELERDDGYREWVLAQPWLAQRYPDFYAILVTGGPSPEDSPEHNQMQARFLEETWRLGLVRCLPALGADGLDIAAEQMFAWEKKNKAINPTLSAQFEIRPARADLASFEHEGWDAVFEYAPAGIEQHWHCECPAALDDSWREGSYPPDVHGTVKYPEISADAWEQGRYKPPKPDKPWVFKPSAPVLLPYSSYEPRENALARYRAALGNYPGQLAQYREELAAAEARYQEQLTEYPGKLAQYTRQRHYALDHRDNENRFGVSTFPRRIATELKPDLGDDYPSVLRQVQRYLTRRVHAGRGQYYDQVTCDASFVVARRAQFRSVTWDQVRKIFAASGIVLLAEDDIVKKAFPADWFRRTA